MKFKLNSKKSLLIASALAFAVTSGASVAGPVVTTWSYSTDADFTAAAYNTGSATSPGPGVTSFGDHELSWGADGGDFENPTDTASANRSALTIGQVGGLRTGGGPKTGFVDTIIGDAAPTLANIGTGISMTHWNNAIAGSFATLETGTLLDTLVLTPWLPNPPYGPASPTVNAPDIVFDFHFVETPNRDSCEPNSTSNCDDLFGIFGIQTLGLEFVYADVTYLANVLILNDDLTGSPISALSDAECAMLDFASGCQGFRTEEGEATTVNFAFSVTAVPEPGPLALMGIGLLGLGYRKFKSA